LVEIVENGPFQPTSQGKILTWEAVTELVDFRFAKIAGDLPGFRFNVIQAWENMDLM